MSGLIPTLPVRTPAEHQTAIQFIFDQEHEPQVFLVSQTESDRVATLHSCNSLQLGELIGLLPDGEYPDYSFTNHGRGWSCPRQTFDRNGRCNGYVGGRFLVSVFNPRGYLKVNLYDDHGIHPLRVNRGVALTHLANPRHFSQVNHIDRNKTNNHASNLEWCTQRYNKLYDLLHRPPGTLLGVAEYSHDPHLNPCH